MLCLSQRCLIHNVFRFRVRSENIEIVSCSDSWTCHEELTMREARGRKIDTSNLKRLSLRFVDGHREGELYWKLQTSSSFAQPVRMVASITWGIRLFTQSLVPLHGLGASRFRRSIIWVPTLSNKLCGGMPEGSRELRNSMGHWTDSSSSATESTDLYEVVPSGSCSWICRLMALTLLFFGARIARS